MKYDIKLSVIRPDITGLKFSIDSPRTCSYFKSNCSAIHLSGWLLYKGCQNNIYIVKNGEKLILDYNTPRLDVVRHFNGNVSDTMCGFSYAITSLESFSIGTTINNVDYVIARVDITPPQKVLFGHNGYLFLDHDTNQSKEQFIGIKKITNDDISVWKNYLDFIRKYMNDQRIEYVFCLAPAKENVLSSYYPFKKSPETPVEQLLSICTDIVYPLDILRDIGDSSYSKVDTHWSDFAALQVAKYIDNILNKNNTVLDNSIFPFYIKRSYGDLGIKTTPPISQDILKADFSGIDNYIVYDNGVNNRGWVRVFENNRKIDDSVVVFFGDSYSINMLPYFVNKYKRVIHVFSGASVDLDVVAHEKPSKIIIQVASRFIVKPPKNNFCFTSEIVRKIYKKKINNFEYNSCPSLLFYYEKMSKLYNTESAPS
ncbi:hypothetical protein [Escherichia coli]|uniref:hypothetical protein n=1 Tax=Escherichia coli TaxID=562 RepID=UPI002DB968DC|nr:hypothetical protein [Escherichia coli]MEC4228250.1 hypothetical protein [Escherichia coli]